MDIIVRMSDGAIDTCLHLLAGTAQQPSRCRMRDFWAESDWAEPGVTLVQFAALS